jgi:hypothetical protein
MRCVSRLWASSTFKLQNPPCSFQVIGTGAPERASLSSCQDRGGIEKWMFNTTLLQSSWVLQLFLQEWCFCSRIFAALLLLPSLINVPHFDAAHLFRNRTMRIQRSADTRHVKEGCG